MRGGHSAALPATDARAGGRGDGANRGRAGFRSGRGRAKRCAAACPRRDGRRGRAFSHRRHHRQPQAGAAPTPQPAVCGGRRGLHVRRVGARRDRQRLSAVSRRGFFRVRLVDVSGRCHGRAAHAAGHAQHRFRAALLALCRARKSHVAGHGADGDVFSADGAGRWRRHLARAGAADRRLAPARRIWRKRSSGDSAFWCATSSA